MTEGRPVDASQARALPGPAAWHMVAVLMTVALMLGLLWLSPRLLCKTCGSTFWLSHLEGLSLATSGKWGSIGGPADAFSGQLPVFYNNLSPALLNALADAAGLPTVVAQTIVWGPLFILALLASAYGSVLAVTRDRLASLTAAVLIAACADAAFVDGLYSLMGSRPAAVKAFMHVPAVSIALGSDQGLGWIFFLPALATFHVALVKQDKLLFFAAGAVFGLLFRAHLLTLLHAATVASVMHFWYNTKREFVGRIRQRRRRTIFALVAIALAVHASFYGFDLSHSILLWTACWLLAIKGRKEVINVTAFGAGALLVAGHSLWHLYEISESLGQMDVVAPVTMSIGVIAVFFLPMWMASGLLLWRGALQDDSDPRIEFAVILLIVTLVMSQGPLFGFTNHPYRFAINLIFPLAILTGLTVRQWLESSGSRMMNAVATGLAVWIGLSIVKLALGLTPFAPQSAALLGTTRAYNMFTEPSPDERDVLRSIREVTAGEGGGRLLIAPEYKYPHGSARAGIMLSYSHVPGFLPDDRYITFKDLAAARVDVFCTLFPEYRDRSAAGLSRCPRNQDAALIASSGGTAQLRILNEAVRADIAPVYGIAYAADIGGELAPLLSARAPRYGWQAVAQRSTHVLYTAAPGKAVSLDRLAFARAHFSSGVWSVPFTAPRAGRYRVYAAGTGAVQQVGDVSVDGQHIDVERSGPNTLTALIDVAAGTHELQFTLVPDWRYTHVEPVPLHFITGLPAASAEQYVVLEPAASP